ncbi:MAG TPA: hypothetical protein VME46_18645 [Acidimicrobiales bacterium]|nr:hypothetical protein [Acidimicrobiales bacterium]
MVRMYRGRTVRLGLACLTCATLLSLPSVAQAETSGAEEITFQEGLVPDNGAITDQYQAAYGVEFGTSGSLGFPGTVPDRECAPALVTDGYTAPGASATGVLLARSAGESGCRQGEFYDTAQGFMFHMDDARASVSFLLLASVPPGDHTPRSDVSAEVVAYGGGGSVLDDVTLSSAEATTWSTVALSTNDPNGIQFVEVMGDVSIDSPVGVQVDNLTLPAAIDYLPPAFSLARSGQPETGDLVEGDTLGVPVQIVRENGSTGTVTVSATEGNSPALSDVTVDQAPMGEPAGTVMVELTARPGQAGQQVTVTVSGTGDTTSGTEEGPPLSLTFTVQADLALSEPEVTPSVGDHCQLPLPLQLHVAGGTPMTVKVSGTGGFSQTLKVTGPGAYPIGYSTVATYSASGSEHLSFQAGQVRTNNFLAPFSLATYKLTVNEPAPEVDLTSGSVYTVPVEAGVYPSARTAFTFNATGLPCVPLELSVGADGALTSPFVPGAAGSGSFTLPVPAAATQAVAAKATGSSLAGTSPMSVVTVAGSDQVIALPGVFLYDFRAMDAPNFLNYIENTATWDDFQTAFGPGINDCSPLFCWHDPISQAWFQYVQNSLPFGLCFGYTMLATELYRGEATPQDFGAATVGQLKAPTNGRVTTPLVSNYPLVDNSTALGQTLLTEWLSQLDETYQVSEHDGIGGYASVAQFIQALSSALAKDHIAIVNIQGPNGVGAHSLVAYALTTTPNGYAIDVYNPDLPYSDSDQFGQPLAPAAFPNEAVNLASHIAALQASQILVSPGGFVYPGPPNSVWQLTGPPTLPNGPVARWSGPISTIGLTTMAERPLDPVLASLNQNSAALAVGVGLVILLGATGSPSKGGPPAAIAQIDAGGKAQLDAYGVPVNGSHVKVHVPTDSGQVDTNGIYELPAGRSYTIKTRTLHPGHFGLVEISAGSGGGVLDATAISHQSDTLTLSPGSPTISFAGGSSAPVTLELVSGAKGETRRTALLSLASGTGETAASLSPTGQLTVHRVGPAVGIAIQLFSQGASAGTSTVQFSSGDTLVLTPNWDKVASSVPATLTGTHLQRLSFSAGRATAFSKLLGVRDRHKKQP